MNEIIYSWEFVLSKGVSRRGLFYMIAGAVLAATWGVLYLFDPLKTAIFPRCPLYVLTGLHCPGCGSLRALHSLFHGDLSGAIAMNPLMVLSIPFIGILFLRPKWSDKPWVPWACFMGLIVYGFVRNIPVWPLVELAPH